MIFRVQINDFLTCKKNWVDKHVYINSEVLLKDGTTLFINTDKIDFAEVNPINIESEDKVEECTVLSFMIKDINFIFTYNWTLKDNGNNEDQIKFLDFFVGQEEESNSDYENEYKELLSQLKEINRGLLELEKIKTVLVKMVDVLWKP